MDIHALIKSGILTKYCLGLCTHEENISIETLSETHPAVKEEIETTRLYFERKLLEEAIIPAASVKTNVMRSVYKQQAATNQSFPPLIENNSSVPLLSNWISKKNIKQPTGVEFDNLFITELPSTEYVINFFVAAKQGHEPEVHDRFTEYLYVIEGSCTMDFDGEKKSYSMGELITIKPNIVHTAVVHSEMPMLALVQRQLF